jgi:hypothetical protein
VLLTIQRAGSRRVAAAFAVRLRTRVARVALPPRVVAALPPARYEILGETGAQLLRITSLKVV